MLIPGVLIALATFPGVVAHEYAHERACQKRDLQIREVCYFQLRSPNGFVRHEQPSRYDDAFWISLAPFTVNTLLAVAFAVVAGVLLSVTRATGMGLFAYATGPPAWLAFSFAWHAMPSKDDAENVYEHAKREWRTSWFARFGFLVVAALYVWHYLSYLWFDALYALLVVGGTIWLSYAATSDAVGLPV
ncbi:hypothetical protein [Halorussus ruber]|uniref:hypothetical protein n=1 Tax=Halorussus ruber TaxID=1126238 RepID=UPI0010931335|nr:hypothetical protein [Halorussus ruber]